ncbi:PBSX family phage terminase large subunit [Sulfurimonas sp. SAG-AH-194-C20]|nr:PBSX family phage terminase large subunit [Sulfurimonas sp. SAG-AH-194-C20]MDF1878853.1 PBSX family phage terminase large subunit [Sulfurimonas sp. SAG-AH-194-C20]
MTYNIDLSNIKDLMTPKGYDMLKVESRYLISYGGSGSSKSYSATQKILFRILTEKNHRILVLRKTARSLKKSVFQLFKEVIKIWNVEELFDYNLTDLTITCKNGNSIIMNGLDNVERLKSISSVSSLWLEEASEVTYQDFIQLDLRLRGYNASYFQLLLTFNPTSSNSWLKKRFFDNQDDKTKVVHSTFLDNPFLDLEYKDILESLISQNKNMYDIYCKGIWGTLKGVIFEDYQVVSDLPSIYDKKSYGVDFGFQHFMTFIEARTVGSDVYFKELYCKTESLVSDLIAFMKEEGIAEDAQIFADSARPDLITSIQNAGFKHCQKANKSVLGGLDYMLSLNIKVTSNSTNLIKELDLYSWSLDSNGEPLDKPVKMFDDCIDSCRYSIFRNEPIQISIANITSRRNNYNYDGYDDKELYQRVAVNNNFSGY